MATKGASLFQPVPTTEHGKGGIVDDFMYGTNVASAHIYIRMGFLRKVYGILSVQLLITTLTSAFFMLHEPTKLFVQNNPWMLLISIIGTIGVLIALMIKQRETPINYILLLVFTLMEAYMVGVIVTFYSKAAVMEAFALTCAVTLSLTAYTFQSKRDFSSWGTSLFALMWVLILAGFMQLFFPTLMMDRLLAIGGALLFSLFIIYDTHMLMHKLSPEEYISASINLYMDIINLFLHILRLVGESRK